MTSKELRKCRRFLYEENKKWPAHLVEVPRDQWPAMEAATICPDFVWRSREFLCQEFHNNDGTVRLSFCRTELDKNGGWKEGFDWDTLQRLKRECGWGSNDAVEIFPSDFDIVNVANMRHLWIVGRLPFKWTSKRPV